MNDETMVDSTEPTASDNIDFIIEKAFGGQREVILSHIYSDVMTGVRALLIMKAANISEADNPKLYNGPDKEAYAIAYINAAKNMHDELVALLDDVASIKLPGDQYEEFSSRFTWGRLVWK